MRSKITILQEMFEVFEKIFEANPLLLGDVFLTVVVAALVGVVVIRALEMITKKQLAKGVVLLVCAVFFVGRFVHFGQVDGFAIADIGWDVVMGGVLIAAAVLLPHTLERVQKNPQTKNRLVGSWKDALIILTLLACVGVQMQHFGRNAIDGDEIFQFEAAAGYLHTGRFVQWDFKTDKPFIDSEGKEWTYDRASGNTWVIVQSMRLFGISESSARLPAVVSFAVFVVGVYVVMRAWLRNRTTAAIVAATFAFSNTFVQMGSQVRMYAPFYLFFGASVVCLYKVFEAYVHSQWKRLAAWVLVGIPLYAVALHLHIIGLILIPCFLLFVVVEWIMQAVQHKQFFSQAVAPMTRAMIVAVIVACGMLIVDQFYRFISWRVLNFHFHNSVYELYAFFDFPIYGFAAALFIIGLVTMFRRTLAMRFLGVVSSSLFFLFLFVLESPSTRRYFGLVSILIIPFVVVSARNLLQDIGVAQRFRKMPALATALVVLCVPLSFPGIPSVGVLNASIDDSATVTHYADAYAYIQQHAAPNDVVLAVSFRNFYWGKDEDTTVLDLQRNYTESLKKVGKMERLMFQYGKGWIVWPKELPRATKEVQEYIKGISHHMGGLENTNMDVFYFDVTNKTPTHQNVRTELLRQADDRMVAAGFESSFTEPQLIKSAADGKLFVFSGGAKRWISSSVVFAACRYVRSDVVEVDVSLFGTLPTGEPIASASDCIAL